ncbi:cellulose binding domain-containing protein [Sorangium cellulosum]|uniref:cellulose binding domain-containing protein n=1 Tax=Sorangium cellulosum TaxID=56 RepID=UPI003D9A9C1C
MRSALLSADGTMEALLTLPSDWGSGYCASVTVTNRSASPTTGWSMVVGLNGSTLDHGWVANITRSNGQFTAANMDWNAEVQPGRSVTWGFCGSGSGRPSIVSVEGSGGSITTSSSTSTSSSVGSGGEGGAGGGSTSVGAGGEGGGSTTTTTSAGEGGGSTSATTTSAGAGGEGGGSTSATTTSAGAGGEGGGSTTTTTTTSTTTSAGAGGEGGGSTTATTTTSVGAGGEGGGSTTATTTSAGAGGEGGAPPGDPACGPDTATFAQVQQILERSCANSFCHGNATTPAGGLDLREAAAVGSLVNQSANSCSSEHALVVPFMPSSSYLMNKLNDVDLCDPDEIAMPPGSPLPAADLKTITDWICAGAPAR